MSDDIIRTHITVPRDVYPELFEMLSKTGKPAALAVRLAADGERWQRGVYSSIAPNKQTDAQQSSPNIEGKNENSDVIKDAVEIGL